MRFASLVESESRSPLALPELNIRRVCPRLRTAPFKMPQFCPLGLRSQDSLVAEVARFLFAGDRSIIVDLY